MAFEQEQTSVAWYSRFARHPYYGRTGINSGVTIFHSALINLSFAKNFHNKVVTVPHIGMFAGLSKRSPV